MNKVHSSTINGECVLIIWWIFQLDKDSYGVRDDIDNGSNLWDYREYFCFDDTVVDIFFCLKSELEGNIKICLSFINYISVNDKCTGG